MVINGDKLIKRALNIGLEEMRKSGELKSNIGFRKITTFQ